jgi:hypothetical protein
MENENTEVLDNYIEDMIDGWMKISLDWYETEQHTD